MFSSTQVVLIAVITIITVLLTFIGIQVIYVLKDVRKLLLKADRVLTDAREVTGTVASSVGSLAGFGAGLKTAISLFSSLKNRFEEDESDYE